MLSASYMHFTDVRLKPGQLYLLDDNRGNSLDGRSEGRDGQGWIRAKVTAIAWPLSGRSGDLPKP